MKLRSEIIDRVMPGFACIAIILSTSHAIAQTPMPGRDVRLAQFCAGHGQPANAEADSSARCTPTWNVIPKTNEEWKAQVDAGAAAATMRALPALRKELRVNVEPTIIDG